MENININDLVLRKSNMNDLDNIISLYNEAKLDPFTHWDETYPKKEDIIFDIENNNGYLLVDKDNNIIGGISIDIYNDFESDKWIKVDKYIEVSRICVKKEYQGHNLSLLMIDKLIEIIKPDSIRLTVVKTNIKAYKNYIKYGFKVVDEMYAYNNDYYLCEKILKRDKDE